MKITKFLHSCLLVEMPAPVNRTVLFDPGVMSGQALDVEKLEYLDDIFITHNHSDHLNVDLVKKMVVKFPDVRITGPAPAVEQLAAAGVTASSQAPDGVTFFEAPHETAEPLAPQPENIGYHYLDMLTDPGDSHSFRETKPILALPVTAPWGSTTRAVNLALKLKPQYVLPIHDWHWRDEAREQIYDLLEPVLREQGITFMKLKTGEPVVIKLD